MLTCRSLTDAVESLVEQATLYNSGENTKLRRQISTGPYTKRKHNMDTRQLYRPVGLFELRLIRNLHYRAFPPRLPHQPIFYPVLNLEYAVQIARDWNSRDGASGFMGAVTAFDVDENYLKQFEEHVVGASMHRELWVPAAELDAFNRRIIGEIRVLEAFYGTQFSGVKEW